jgi:hypothetical protein
MGQYGREFMLENGVAKFGFAENGGVHAYAPVAQRVDLYAKS